MKIIIAFLIMFAACAVPVHFGQDEQGLTCSGSPYCNPWKAVRNGNGPDKVQFSLEHDNNSDWVCLSNCDDDSHSIYCPEPTDAQSNECDDRCHLQPDQYRTDCYVNCYNQLQTRCAAGEVP